MCFLFFSIKKKQCLESIQKSSLPEASELAKLLSQYEIEGVLWAHDTVAQDVLPQTESAATTAQVTIALPADECSMYDTEQRPPNINIINIEKTNEPLVLSADVGRDTDGDRCVNFATSPPSSS